MIAGRFLEAVALAALGLAFTLVVVIGLITRPGPVGPAAVDDLREIPGSVGPAGTLAISRPFDEPEPSDVFPRTVARLEATLEAMEEALDTLREIQELIERLAADAGNGVSGAPSAAAPPGEGQ